MILGNALFRWLLVWGLVLAGWWVVGGSPVALAAEATAYLAWGERDATGTYRMHFSRHDGEGWSFPVLLSDGAEDEILPAVGPGHQGSVWVAWTELQGIYGVIRYRFFSSGKWGAPGILSTATISDLAPWLAVDPEGRAWMVFSGSDGSQDDVYAVHWLGDGWSVPEKVHPDNQTPDILPRIEMDMHGRPVVTWQGVDGERYRTFSSVRGDLGWIRVRGGERSGRFVGTDDHCDALRDFPDFVGDISQAVVWTRFGESGTFRPGEADVCQ